MRAALGRYALPALVVLVFAITVALTFPHDPGAETGAAITTLKPSGPTSAHLQTPTPASVPEHTTATAPQRRARIAPVAPAESSGTALPVRMSFPYPLNSRFNGRTLVLVAMGDEPMAVEVTISNDEAGKHLEQLISLNPPKRVQLGRDDGFEPESGDRVMLHVQGHADLTGIVP